VSDQDPNSDCERSVLPRGDMLEQRSHRRIGRTASNYRRIIRCAAADFGFISDRSKQECNNRMGLEVLMSGPKPKCNACRQIPALFPFTMAFQPIVDLQNNQIESHEALVRGPKGEGAGTVLDQLNDANRYAFDQACRVKAIELASALKLEGNLNINFLPNAVYEPKACIRLTLEVAHRTGFPLNRLTFEFTENEQVADINHTVAIITEYRRHGFKIALDDFGTGYSGLARLTDLQPDIIKLDRALIENCDQNKMRLSVVRSMISLGTELGIKVVAEGVERLEEVNALRSVGVRFIQGFYFARPVFEGVARDNDINWPVFAGAARSGRS
jgi:EAL domain-containing protein (putative c-di-GMP-specific phosphodiesterase class I)